MLETQPNSLEKSSYKMNVPFVDLKVQYLSIKDEMDAAISHVLENTAFIGGSVVRDFEAAFCKEYGVRNCVSVANGTDAIYIAMKMLGIGAGDEVITVANSWISTSETITQAGAKPVFVDIDEFFSIDASQIEAKITSKTKAIIPVHLHGQMTDIKTIKAICEKHGLFLIEDCAQSHFSQFDGQLAGTFGNAGTFSFYPGKNLGAYGDAGCIITNDDELAQKMRMYANHGSLKKHAHQIEGINSRLDGIQAAVLTVKLKYIRKWTEQRRANAQKYSELLADVAEIATPKVRPNSIHSYHLYVIRTKEREALSEFLQSNGVETAIHYPCILPMLPAYAYLRHSSSDFPAASDAQGQILSLPMFPELSAAQIEHVANSIKAFYSKK